MANNKNFIKTSVEKLIRMIFKKRYLYNFFLLTLLIITSCAEHKKKETLTSLSLGNHDKKKLSTFLEFLMDYSGGAYTLYGSKPMTYMDITVYSEDQKNRIREKNDNSILVNSLDLDEGWEILRKLQEKLPSKRFLIFINQDTPLKNTKEVIKEIYFINIELCATLMKKYYREFYEVIGEDFHPYEILVQANKAGSIFSTKILTSSFLSGILFGFGYENALGWSQKNDTKLIGKSKQKTWNSQIAFSKWESLKKPFLPQFICDPSYSITQKLKNEYLLTQIEIITTYRKGDFLEDTLQELFINKN